MRKSEPRARFFILTLIIAYSAAAEAAVANAEDDKQGDDYKPYNLVLEKIAEAVHSIFLSSYIFVGPKSYPELSGSTINICEAGVMCALVCFRQGQKICSFF